MPFRSSETRAILKLVEALRPYLAELVFIGGWGHRLLSLHELAARLPFEQLATEDVDLAAPPRVEVRGASIRDRLQAAGFSEELSGDEQPPVSHYTLGSEASGLYVEFLVPLIGGERGRHGESRATARVAGVSAQRLRYLDLLLKEPWMVELNHENGFDFARAQTVRVPNPAAYVIQKLLSLGARRAAGEKAKDALYVHDTLLMFARGVDRLRPHWQRSLDQLPKRARSRLSTVMTTLYASVSDPVAGASVIARRQGRTQGATSEEIRVATRQILAELSSSP